MPPDETTGPLPAYIRSRATTAGYDLDARGERSRLARDAEIDKAQMGRLLEGRITPNPQTLWRLSQVLKAPYTEMLLTAGLIPREAVGQWDSPPPAEPVTTEALARKWGVTDPQSIQLIEAMLQRLRNTAADTAPPPAPRSPQEEITVPLNDDTAPDSPADRPRNSSNHGDQQAPEGEGVHRLPPQDLAAEQAVLGGMLLSKDAIADVNEVLKPADYYRPAHQVIHGAIVDLFTRGEPADPITVAGELTKRGELARVGGPGYLHTLAGLVPTAANAEYYAEIVHERAVLRRLVDAGTRIAGMGYAADGDVDEIVNAAQAEIHAVAGQRASEKCEPLADIMEGALDDIEEAAPSSPLNKGIPTGFADLDTLLGGLRPGTLTVIASRPAVGRTTLISDFVRTAAIHNNLPTVVFTVEETRNDFVLRLTSAEARVALHHLRNGRMTDEDWTRTARRMPDITNAPLFIDAPPRLTTAQIAEKSRGLAKSHDLKLIAVDGLQSIRPEKRSDLREREVGDIVRDLKALARELDVPLVVTAHLNRGPEQRTDRKPRIDELRESGAITFEADTIILLHREDAYEKESPRAGEADFLVAKNRHGQTATLTVAFQGHYGRFVDMTRDVPPTTPAAATDATDATTDVPPQDPPAANSFAQWLASAMRAAGLDIDRQRGGGRTTLATAVGVSPSTVYRWLDANVLPGVEYLDPIARALNVSPIDMLTASGLIKPGH
jgi:replicative DNA helicase